MLNNSQWNLTLCVARPSSSQDPHRPVLVWSQLLYNLPEHHVLIKVERFGFSANNVTYQALGEAPQFRYASAVVLSLKLSLMVLNCQLFRFSSCPKHGRGVTQDTWTDTCLGFWHCGAVYAFSNSSRGEDLWLPGSLSLPPSPRVTIRCQQI